MFSYRTLLDAASVLLAFSVLYTAFFAPLLFAHRLLAPGDAQDRFLLHFQLAQTVAGRRTRMV